MALYNALPNFSGMFCFFSYSERFELLLTVVVFIPFGEMNRQTRREGSGLLHFYIGTGQAKSIIDCRAFKVIRKIPYRIFIKKIIIIKRTKTV